MKFERSAGILLHPTSLQVNMGLAILVMSEDLPNGFMVVLVMLPEHSHGHPLSPEGTADVNELIRTGFGKCDVRLGVGFRFGGYNLDATVNDDALRQEFNLVGGGVASFAYLSASYAF